MPTSPITRRSLVAATLGCSVNIIGCHSKAKPFPGFAAVVKGDSPSVALVDLAAFTLSDKIEFGAPISQVLYREESRSLYALSASSGMLFEYDWAARHLRRSLRLGTQLRYARFDPSTAALWVSVIDPPALLKVVLAEFLVQTRARLPRSPIAFDVANWEARLVASLEGGGLALSSAPMQTEFKILRESAQFGVVRFRSDGRQLLAANHADKSLSIVSAEDGASLVDLPIAMEARNFCFKPDGGQLFLTDGESGGVTIIYPYTTEVDRAVLAGTSPGAMTTSSNPPYLLVANRASSDVTILDLDTGKLVAIVPVGTAPSFLAVTPDNQFALALNEVSGDMAVIRLGAVRSLRNKTAPLFTMVPVGEAPKSLAVIPA